MQEFSYEVHYLPGSKNIVSDALSQRYSDEPAGVVHVKSKIVSSDSDSEDDGKSVKLYQPLMSTQGTRFLLPLQFHLKRLG